MTSDLHVIEFETSEGTVYIEGFLRGSKGQTLVITDIHVPRSLWRRGIGKQLMQKLKEKVGARRVVAYNVRQWGPAEDFFEAENISEVFTSPKPSGKIVWEEVDPREIWKGPSSTALMEVSTSGEYE